MKEINKLEENSIVTYNGGSYYGLRKKKTGNEDDVYILKAEKKNGYTTLLPSRCNTRYGLPIVATYNKYSEKRDNYVRGVIEIKGFNDVKEINIPHEYDFIDGFDGGLARVYRIIEGKKKWGIIGMYKIDDKVRIEELVAPQYDILWNFYGKNRTHIPAEINGTTVGIFLEKLRDGLSEMNNKKNEESPNSIDEIEVTNFKKYIEPAKIDLSSRITFLVGKNNAGKSTLLDAIEMLTNNLSNLSFTSEGQPFFRFDESDKHEKQAENHEKYHNMYTPSSQPIKLRITSGLWNISLMIKNNAIIEEIVLCNINNAARFVFNKESATIEIADLLSKTYLTSELDKDTPEESEHSGGFDPLMIPLMKTLDADKSLSELQRDAANDMYSSVDKAVTTSSAVTRLRVFAPIAKKIYDENPLFPHSMEPYVAIDIIRQINSFMPAEIVEGAIRCYYENNWYNNEKIYYQFVKKWLDRMEMGQDFIIRKDHASNSYMVKIINDHGKETDLCDMGSGTIHFFILCLQLMVIVDAYAGNAYAPIVLIEEPEQNLHPMLQSHIANFLLDLSDLFAEISTGSHRVIIDKVYLNQSYSATLKILVETHSEYIIRRSQVITKGFCEEGEETPFRVYYIPSDEEAPYDMKYKSNGRFENEFGEGFTDESTILSYQLI